MSKFVAVSSQECALLFILVMLILTGLLLYRVSMKFEESVAKGAPPTLARSRSYRAGIIMVTVAAVMIAFVWFFQVDIFYRWLGVG